MKHKSVKVFGFAALLLLTSSCGKKEEIPEPVLCATASGEWKSADSMWARGPTVEVVDAHGVPVQSARVGFTSFDIAPSPPPNDGGCQEDTYNGSGFYYCSLAPEQVEIVHQIHDHQRSGVAGFSVEKAGYKTAFNEVTDIEYIRGPCFPGGYFVRPDRFKVVLEVESP